MNKIKKILAPFSFPIGKLQDIANLLNSLAGAGISNKEFLQYIEAQSKLIRAGIKKENEMRKAAIRKYRDSLPNCTACSTKMNIFPVNTVAGDQTGDNSQSVWICPKCGETVYNLETVAEILAGTK